jgi:hypothetical protein
MIKYENSMFKFVSVILLLTIAACSSRQQMTVNNEAGYPYAINLEDVYKDEKKVALSSIAKEITYIPLETTSDNLLKSVNHIAFLGNRLFIGDYTNLYQFDMSGKFIRKVGTRGLGPFDYMHILALVPDKSANTLYLFTEGKINQYNSDATFVKSISTKQSEPYMYAGAMISEDKFLMYIGNQYKLIQDQDTSKTYSFVEIDTLGQTHKKIPRQEPLFSTYQGMIIAPVMYQYDDKVYFLDYATDTLFVYPDSGKMEPYAVCPLGSMKCPANITGLNKPQVDALSSKLRIDGINEDSRLLYIKLIWGVNGNPFYTIYDKTIREIKGIGENGFENDIDGGVSFFPRQIGKGDIRISWEDAVDFKEKILSLDYNSGENTYGDKFKIVYNLASSLNEDDNPVLIIAK